MSLWIIFVALLIPTPILLAKKEPIAHYNQRHQYNKKEPANRPVRFASAGRLGGRCPGLSVGLSPKISDVVKDGEVAPNFAVNSDASVENIVGSEDVRTIFYFHKRGKPVEIDVQLQYTTSHISPLLSPVLDGVMAEDNVMLNESAASLGIEYKCNYRGGVSAMWLTIAVRAKDGACRPAAHGHHGGLHHQASRTFNLVVIWEKFCSDSSATATGFNIGLTPSSAEVVANGETVPAFRVDDSSVAVAAHELSSRFFIYTMDGTSKVFGPPTLIVDQTQLLVTFHGEAEKGGVASNEAKELEVRYMCAMEHVTALITIEVDVCGANVRPSDCSFETSDGRHPLNFQYTKVCRKSKLSKYDGLFWFLMLVIAIAICYRFGELQDQIKLMWTKARPQPEPAAVSDNDEEGPSVDGDAELLEVILPSDDTETGLGSRVSLLDGHTSSTYGSTGTT